MQADIEAKPLLFNSFMVRDANEAPLYACAPTMDALKKALEEKLTEYNENHAGASGVQRVLSNIVPAEGLMLLSFQFSSCSATSAGTQGFNSIHRPGY